MNKDEMIKAVHKFYRNDLWVNALYSAISIEISAGESDIERIISDLFLDTASEEAIRKYERELDIRPIASQTLEERKGTISAKWRSNGSVNIALIQAIADSWKNGKVLVSFTGGKLCLTFCSEYGIPADLDTLINAIDEVKPAHLPLSYEFKFYLIKDIHEQLTLAEIERLTLDKFAK